MSVALSPINYNSNTLLNRNKNHHQSHNSANNFNNKLRVWRKGNTITVSSSRTDRVSNSSASSSSSSSSSVLIEETATWQLKEEEKDNQTQQQQQQQQQQEAASESESIARRLILLRHAHSSWDNPSLRDHARPLSKEGEDAAAKLSIKLQKLGWIPQLILSSDAVRTKETLRLMRERAPLLSEAEVHFISSFYSIAAMDGQTAYHLQQTICSYSHDNIHTVMCMGHNRGWEEAASVFAGTSIELKTCNAALLEANGKSWEEAFALAGPGGWKLHSIVRPNEQ